MIKILFAIFLILHGMVHLLYFGQSARYFELQPGMTWPDGSWMFSRFLGNETIRTLAGVLLVLAALGFVISGVGIFVKQTWWHTAVVVTATLSSLIFILFWNGGLQHLDNQGWIGILINLVILVVVLVFQWPDINGISQ